MFSVPVSGHCRAPSEKEDFLITTMVGVYNLAQVHPVHFLHLSFNFRGWCLHAFSQSFNVYLSYAFTEPLEFPLENSLNKC